MKLYDQVRSKTLRILFAWICSCMFFAVQAKEEGALQFVPNQGQWAEPVLFKAGLYGGDVFFTRNGFRYNFYSQADMERAHGHEGEILDTAEKISYHAYDVIFEGSKPTTVDGSEQFSFYHNYFLGNDPQKWAGDVPVFRQVRYTDLYDHISMNIYSRGASLKYDLVVQPGGRTGDIRMSFDGVEPFVDKNGDLEIVTSVNTIIERAPYAYQVINGNETAVPCKYVLKDGRLSFAFPEGYDKSRDLVIDPVLVFSTYTGSTGDLWAYCSAYDALGNFYSGSEAYATGFPATTGAYQVNYLYHDIAINKYNSTGTNLLYSTYCGGSMKEHPTAMIVNGNNELVVSGQTFSSNYPVTSAAYDVSFNSDSMKSDIFVTVFSPGGNSLVGSTFMGGSNSDGIAPYAIHDNDQNKSGLCIDAQNNIYVGGTTLSKNFPVTSGALQVTPGSTYDGCIFKLNRTCSSLYYSTYLGGDHQDCIYDCKLAGSGKLVVCGRTVSSNFPLSTSRYADTGSAFVTIINSSATSILASTRLGVYSLSALKVSLDDHKNVFVCGNNDTEFAVTPGTYHQPKGKIFIAKMTPGLDTLLLSTKMVNTPKPGVTGFVNICDDVVMSVYVKDSSSLPLTANAYQSDFAVYYFFHLSQAMDTLIYATYFGVPHDLNGHAHGSSVIDTSGVIWLSTCNQASKHLLPGTTGSYCPVSKSRIYLDNDHLSVKFDMEVLAVKPIARCTAPDTACINTNLAFSNTSKNSYSYIWDFGDGDTSHLKNPVHNYDTTGTYMVKLEAYNPYSCKTVDIAYHTIYIDSIEVKAIFTVADTVCIAGNVKMPNTSQNALHYLWDYGDGVTDTARNGAHTYYTAGAYTVRLVAFNPTLCNNTDTAYHAIIVDATSPGADFKVSTSPACVDMPLQFQNKTARGGGTYKWDFGDGSGSQSISPVHSYTTWGMQNVRLIASNYSVCVPVDTTYHPVEILQPLQIELADSFVCGDEPVKWGVKIIHAHDFVTYQWQPVNAILSATDVQFVTINPKVSKKYIVTVTDSVPGLCSHIRIDTGNIIVVDYPKGTFAHSNTPLCEGDTLKLEAGTTSTMTGIVYSWTGPENFSGGGSSTERTKTTRNHSGIYTVKIDNQGCVVDESTEVTVKPVPFIQAGSNSPVYSGYSLKLSMTTDMALDSLLWQGPNGFYSYDKNPVIDPVSLEATGTYTVAAMLNGCVGGAITVVRVDEPDSQYIHIYPNPNTGTFYIEGKGHNEQQVKILVINSVGQKIFHTEATTAKKYFKQKIVLPAVAGGVYILHVLMDAEYWSYPFTVIRD